MGSYRVKGYSQIQYIPYDNRGIDNKKKYEIKNNFVPGQKKNKEYCAVDHVIDYRQKKNS